MIFESTHIEGVWVIEAERLEDERGFFARTWDVDEFAERGLNPRLAQCATAYGVSPRLRVDVVVNNLVGYAQTTGEILIQSDGTPWRPPVHVEDIGSTILAVLHAPREVVHDEAFNVGASAENYRIRQVAETSRRSCRARVPRSPRTAARTSAPTRSTAR